MSEDTTLNRNLAYTRAACDIAGAAITNAKQLEAQTKVQPKDNTPLFTSATVERFTERDVKTQGVEEEQGR